MDNLGIFIIGCIVFGVVLSSTFIALLASDKPNKNKPSHPAEEL